MSQTTDPASAAYCPECGTITPHNNGECVDCAHAYRNEQIAWMRLKRKLLTIAAAIVFIFVIMWAMAQKFSGDDIVKGMLVSLVTSFGVWFGTSMKAEEKIRSGGDG